MEARVLAYRVRLAPDGTLIGEPLGVRLSTAGEESEVRYPGVTKEAWEAAQWLRAREA